MVTSPSHFLCTFVAPQIKLLVSDDEDEEQLNNGDQRVLEEGDSEEEGEDEEDGEEEEEEIGEDGKSDDNVIEKLKELVEVVEVCLNSNPGMQSTDLIDASKNLLKTYKSQFTCTHTHRDVCESGDSRVTEGVVWGVAFTAHDKL